jgi:hypothetical protein
MGWKEDLKRTADGIARHDAILKGITSLLAAQSKRISELTHTVKTMSSAADRMADRLIEMAMVNNGAPRDASIHRRALQDEVPQEQADLWQDNPSTEWPPPGHDALNL